MDLEKLVEKLKNVVILLIANAMGARQDFCDKECYKNYMDRKD